MKINRFLLLTCILATLANAQTRTIAVLEIVPSGEMGLKLSEYRHLTDELRTRAREALPQSRYTILTRDNILSLMPPDSEEAQCLAESCAVDIGRAIGAEYVTQGFVGEFSGMLTLTVELYESISGNLLGSFVTESESVIGLLNTIRGKAPDLFKKIQQTTLGKSTQETEKRSFFSTFNPSIRAGLSFSYMKLLLINEENVDGEYVEKEKDTDNFMGVHIGVIFDFPLSDISIGTISLQPGIMFTKKGGIWEDEKEYSYYTEKSKGTFNLNYLEIPLTVSLKIPINESLSARANVGFYLAVGISGTLKDEYTECRSGTDDCESYSNDVDIFNGGKGLKSSDYGLSFAGGIEFHNFYAGITYGLGLSNILGDDYGEITTRTINFTLGYNF